MHFLPNKYTTHSQKMQIFFLLFSGIICKKSIFIQQMKENLRFSANPRRRSGKMDTPEGRQVSADGKTRQTEACRGKIQFMR